jgi:GR25 family glycosyltransferase involved in LPS biosynthesis
MFRSTFATRRQRLRAPYRRSTFRNSRGKLIATQTRRYRVRPSIIPRKISIHAIHNPILRNRLMRLVPKPVPKPPKLIEIPIPPPPPPPKPFNIDDYSVDVRMFPYNPVESKQNLEWPFELLPMYVISMRPERYNGMIQRMQNWAPLLTLFPATDGRKIDYGVWKHRLNTTDVLTRGRIGCYESHVRVWKCIVDSRLPHALVLEDDANIVYTQDTIDRLQQMIRELEHVEWDIVYIGNVQLHPFKRQVSEHLYEMSNWEGTYTYYINQNCARIFYEYAFPIEKAVDIYMAELFQKHNLKALALVPPLNYVVPVDSDTI